MIWQCKIDQLSEDQLALLVYSFKDLLTDSEGQLINGRLTALNLHIIIPKLQQLEETMTEEGKIILKDLITTLTSYP